LNPTLKNRSKGDAAERAEHRRGDERPRPAAGQRMAELALGLEEELLGVGAVVVGVDRASR
jgi:hypothetical protein